MFGDIVKALRIEAGLTQDDLAVRYKVTRSVISKYELGMLEPTLEFLINFSNDFNISLDYLLGKTNIRTPAYILDQFNKLPPEEIRHLSEILLYFKNNPNHIKFIHTIIMELKELK